MKKHGIVAADILLPENNFEKWAVVACDQFTSEPEYWQNADNFVGETPSALRVVLPEVYLEGDIEARIDNINATMLEYLNNGVLKEHKNTMIYVERTQSDGTVRHGIIGAIDLCDYDYKKGSKALIRATEQTVIERIPPRVKIRKDAAIELPHVLLLVDDPQKTVIEPLKNKKNNMKPAYDFELMLGGGHIKGWFIEQEDIERIGVSVDKLIENDSDKLMFAVGDGNHSLATAKECSLLTDSEAAKSALVEVVNIHDDSICFEPIYRVLFDVNPEDVVKDLNEALGGGYSGADAQVITCVFGGKEITVSVKPTSKLPVGTLQTWLDEYIAEKQMKIDYIHGDDVVRDLTKNGKNIGFLFDGMRKDELFEAVRSDGSLPRKTFSMGHAADKRYYIEARKIK